MRIRTEEQLKNFENTINSCRSDVYLLTPEGRQYDLKKPMDRYFGISLLLDERAKEPELFATCHEDEQKLMRYITAFAA